MTTTRGRFPVIADHVSPPSSLTWTPMSSPTKSRPCHVPSGRTVFVGTWGSPPERSVQVAPRSCVTRRYGSLSPVRYPVTVRNAVLASNGSGSMSVTQYAGPVGLTFVQLAPEFAVTHTLPSSVPAQTIRLSTADGLTAVTVPRIKFWRWSRGKSFSGPSRPPKTTAPFVRSGLIALHEPAEFVVR